jgi:molybdenum cofactor cytidylyltransferase
MDTWKMTLPWGQSTIIEHSVRTALVVCTRVVLVVGYRAEQLIDIFGEWPQVEVVRNERYESGMFSSVQRAAQAAGEHAFFLALADMPGVSAAVYERLLEWSMKLTPVFSPSRSAYAVIPKFRGKKGHPLLLSSQMRDKILQTDAGKTLRDVLAEVPTMVVPVQQQAVLQDIDTPADYRSWSGQRRNGFR